jgi:hypothetical protein
VVFQIVPIYWQRNVIDLDARGGESGVTAQKPLPLQFNVHIKVNKWRAGSN